jgi:DNA-binding CsgD family transcriptional regulator
MAKTARGSFSYAEERNLLQLAKSGKSLEEIARMMGRPAETIRRVAKRLGVSVKPKAK